MCICVKNGLQYNIYTKKNFIKNKIGDKVLVVIRLMNTNYMTDIMLSKHFVCVPIYPYNDLERDLLLSLCYYIEIGVHRG